MECDGYKTWTASTIKKIKLETFLNAMLLGGAAILYF